MLLLTILSKEGFLVDMERFARRHHQTLNKLLGTDFAKEPSGSTFQVLLSSKYACIILKLKWRLKRNASYLSYLAKARFSRPTKASQKLIEAYPITSDLICLYKIGSNVSESPCPASAIFSWSNPCHESRRPLLYVCNCDPA